MAGVPSVFVRLAGCSLRCTWCDTKYAWDDKSGQDYRLEKIIEEVDSYKSRFVVITGGEPMESSPLGQLTKDLKKAGKHVTVETAGNIFNEALACDLMSISPKLSNSRPTDKETAQRHEDRRLNIVELRKLLNHYDYQLKFVVESQDDMPEIKSLIKELGNVDEQKVMLMAQAVTREELLERSAMLAEMCRQSGFVFCQRLQVLLWPGQRGK